MGKIHDGKIQAILFGGCVHSFYERRHSIIDKELLAMLLRIKCEIYVSGEEVFIYTDNAPLLSLETFNPLVLGD